MHLLDQRSSALAGDKRLDSDDLDGVSSGSVPGSHVSVTLGNSMVNGQVTVLSEQNKGLKW